MELKSRRQSQRMLEVERMSRIGIEGSIGYVPTNTNTYTGLP